MGDRRPAQGHVLGLDGEEIAAPVPLALLERRCAVYRTAYLGVVRFMTFLTLSHLVGPRVPIGLQPLW